jgi:hypothetical protein
VNKGKQEDQDGVETKQFEIWPQENGSVYSIQTTLQFRTEYRPNTER